MQVGSPAWDVFDRDGRYLGVVDTPAGFAPRKFQGDAVYGVLQDELGVPRVARYRIVRGTSAASIGAGAAALGEG